MITVDGECSAQDPVVVGLLKQNLGTGFGVDGANGFVGAPEGNSLAVGRPGCAEDGIVCNGHRQRKLLIGDVPNLNFARTTGATAGDGELFAIGRKADGFNSLG